MKTKKKVKVERRLSVYDPMQPYRCTKTALVDEIARLAFLTSGLQTTLRRVKDGLKQAPRYRRGAGFRFESIGFDYYAAKDIEKVVLESDVTEEDEVLRAPDLAAEYEKLIVQLTKINLLK